MKGNLLPPCHLLPIQLLVLGAGLKWEPRKQPVSRSFTRAFLWHRMCRCERILCFTPAHALCSLPELDAALNFISSSLDMSGVHPSWADADAPPADPLDACLCHLQ